MITDPPAMPLPVIAAALKEPLALTAPEAARAARRSRSGSSGSGNGGASGSSGSAGSPPRSPAPAPEGINANTTGSVPLGAAATLSAASSEPAAAAVPSEPPQLAECARGSTDQPRPAPGPEASATGASNAPASSSAAASAAPPPAAAAAAPLSLQDQCCKVILRNVSVHNCLELLGAVQGRQAPSLETLAAACLRYVVISFETLQGLRTDEELRAVLSAEVYDNLISAQQERVKAVEEMRRVGRAVERRLPQADLGPVQVPSVTGRPMSYPPEALTSGVIWPNGVQASDRETWLSEEDFRRLFKGMGWEEYCKLPAWKKTGVKQEAGMF